MSFEIILLLALTTISTVAQSNLPEVIYMQLEEICIFLVCIHTYAFGIKSSLTVSFLSDFLLNTESATSYYSSFQHVVITVAAGPN